MTIHPEDQPAPRATARRRPGCLARLAIVGLSIAFSLLLAEGVVRLFADEVLPNPIGPRSLYVPDEDMGIDLRPGFRGRFRLLGEFDVPIAINSRGFRDREFGPKQEGVRRILSLGDSFGFGYGVRGEDTYAKQLEQRLNRGLPTPRFEVLNAGASGRGIPHMIRVLERTQAWFEPDVVLASFFYVNDLLDIANFPEHTVRGGIVLTRGFGALVDRSPWLTFSVRYSDLSLLAWRTWFNVLERSRGSAFRLGDQPPPGEYWGLDMLQVHANSADPADAERIARRGGLWRQFETHLATLRRTCETGGAKLVLFTIPQEYQTRDALWQRMKADGLVDEERHDRDLIGKQLTAICERTGVRFLDLVPAFRGQEPQTTRFFPLNKHFNEAGHAFTAEVLERFLRAHDLL